MKKGDFITKNSLFEKGFEFTCYFAGYHVYKTVEDNHILYVFHDYIKQEVVSTLTSNQ